MTERPTAVTVIGWYLRVGGVVGMVLSIPLAIVGPELWGDFYPDAWLELPSSVQGFIGFVASLFCLLSGNGILRGQNWGRTLALIICGMSTLAAVGHRSHPFYWFNLIGNLAFILMFWFFLFRSQSSAFFKGAEVPVEV